MQYLGVMWRTEFDFELVYLSKGLKLHPFQCTCCLEQRERDKIVRFCDLSIQVATVVFDYRSLSFALREKQITKRDFCHSKPNRQKRFAHVVSATEVERYYQSILSLFAVCFLHCRNSTLINLFDTKFSCFLSLASLQVLFFLEIKPFIHVTLYLTSEAFPCLSPPYLRLFHTAT